MREAETSLCKKRIYLSSRKHRYVDIFFCEEDALTSLTNASFSKQKKEKKKIRRRSRKNIRRRQRMQMLKC